jgi:hypothetical protein
VRDCVPRTKSGRMDGVRRWYPTVVVVLAVAGIVGVGVVANPFRETPCATRVQVAMELIPQGTSGAAIVKRRMYVTATLTCDERKSGAIADPMDIFGTTVVGDLLPGQQLAETDFTSRWSSR